MKLTGGEIIAEYLIKEGIPYIVGIPGHGILGLIDAFKGKEDKIKVIQVRHEQSAVHFADGYYRVTGKPLAVFTSIGPGAVNTAVGVATCYVDSTPVLLITGETHTYMFGRGVLQEIERTHDANFPRMLEPVVKRWWQATAAEQLPEILEKAFNQMLSGRRGPVLISLPMDVQSESADVEISKAKRRAENRFFGDPKDIDEAIGLLLKAKRPVILAGGGMITSEASSELKELAEFLQAAVITTMMGKSSFPEDHPLYAWHTGSKGTSCGNKISSTADVLLAVGCRFADLTTSSYRKGVSFSIPPTKLIHVDIDPGEIGKNYPVAVGIIGDAKSVMQQLIEKLKNSSKPLKRDSYVEEIQRLKDEWFQSLRELRESNKVPMTISRFLKELREFLPRDGIVLTSAGHPQAQVLQELPLYAPRTLVTSGGFSTMGFVVPAALGVKLAAGERLVIGVIGDGDFLMTIQELATAVQYNLPVVYAVLNNIGWISIRDLQLDMFGKERGISTEFFNRKGELYSPDFAAIAQAFGAYGERIQKGEEVKPALERAFASGKPVVIEVMVNREYPYSAGKVAGQWDVPVPAYLKKSP
ncbi:MAG: thiamine pyrophosphate-binding protein [Dehalococcoidales bacterium]